MVHGKEVERTSSPSDDKTYENANGKRMQGAVVRPEFPFFQKTDKQPENECEMQDMESAPVNTEENGLKINSILDTHIMNYTEGEFLLADMLNNILFPEQHSTKETDQNTSMNYKHDQVAVLTPQIKQGASKVGSKEQISKDFVSGSDLFSIEDNGLTAICEHFELIGCKVEVHPDLVVPDLLNKKTDSFLGQEIDETSQNQSADEEMVKHEGTNETPSPGTEETKTDGKVEDISLINKKGKEEDPVTLARRMKQICYGKSTTEYQRFVSLVPKNQRLPGDPKTPPMSKKFSRRGWDGLVKIWRQRLHEFDPPNLQ